MNLGTSVNPSTNHISTEIGNSSLGRASNVRTLRQEDSQVTEPECSSYYLYKIRYVGISEVIIAIFNWLRT